MVDSVGRLSISSPRGPLHVWGASGVDQRFKPGQNVRVKVAVQAVDMVPLQPITRDAMIRKLCAIHARSGQGYGVGLGFYVGLRFHVDSRKFRTWGTNDEGTIACARSFEMAHSNDPGAAGAQPTAQSVVSQSNSTQPPQN